jgi:Tol biopolymer transport system component
MLMIGLCCVVGAASSFTIDSTAKLWLPDFVSTPNTEVRITFSPDGQRMLWGTMGWSGGVGGWDIFESVRNADGWSKPAPVSFNSGANDFDPSFAPDGSGVYFFSNRAAGFGKDDLYFAAFDVETDRYDVAVNLGAGVNTAGEEWAPVVSPDGKQLLFASDGHGGKGKHDLFIAQRTGERWDEPRNVEALNSSQEDFDAAFLEDGRSIVFSRGDLEGSVVLYVSQYANGGLQPPLQLDESVNSKEPDAWTFGPSTSAHDRGALYVTSQRQDHRGRADIYRIEYRLAK